MQFEEQSEDPRQKQPVPMEDDLCEEDRKILNNRILEIFSIFKTAASTADQEASRQDLLQSFV